MTGIFAFCDTCLPVECTLRISVVVFLFWLFSLCGAAQAVTIDPGAGVGAIPTTAGGGLNGSFYKFSTTCLTSFAQANLLIAAVPYWIQCWNRPQSPCSLSL